MLFSVKSIAGFLLAAAGVTAYTNPKTCTGACWAHDPSLIKRSSDGYWFRFSTGSEIGIWKASSLTGTWTYKGAALPDGSSIDLDGNTDLWAPDVHYVNGKYIMYYAVSTSGSQTSAIGYATSSTMEYGSWTDHGSTGISSTSSKNYNAIDPALIESEDGDYYMNFGSFWGDIYQVAMNSAATKSSGSAYQIAYNATGDHSLEGSYMYYRSGYYYLFFSSGICCGYDSSKPSQGEEYKVMVCRSTSVSGTFYDKSGTSCLKSGGTEILASHGTVYGPGGQGVLADDDYGTIIYYHYADTSVGLADSEYLFGWNVLGWSSGWPSV